MGDDISSKISNVKLNIIGHLQFNYAHNLIKKLIKLKLLFHLVLIKNVICKKTHKRSSVINWIYSGQQLFPIIIKFNKS